MNSSTLSRRSFLTGVVGAVATAATTGATVAALPGTALAAFGGPPSQSPRALPPDVANDWIETLYDVVLAEGLTPPNAARIYNYGTLAMYEAAVAGMPAHRSLGGQLTWLDAVPVPRRSMPLDWPSGCRPAWPRLPGRSSTTRARRHGRESPVPTLPR